MSSRAGIVLCLLIALCCQAQAAITTAQKKELNAIKVELGKVTGLISKKKLEEADQAISEAEKKLEEYVKAEEIPDNDSTLKAVRQLLEKQKAAYQKAGGKVEVADVSFTDDVASIFIAKCISCHGDDPKGGLRLDTFAGMEKGGANGPLVFIGKPQQSLLMARLTTPNAQLRMPKDGDALTAEEIKTISDWITSGAKFDAEDKNAKLNRLEKPKPAVQVAKPTGSERISFVKDIAPGFAESCLRCHNGNNRSGGFSMVTFEKLMQGGDSGKVLTPGKLDDSKLWVMITEGDMPRQQGRISRKWYNDLKIWIEEGCKYDHNDPKLELVKLIPSDEEKKMAELAKLTPEQFAERRIATSDEQWTKTFPQLEVKKISGKEFNVYGDVSDDRLKQINEWAEEYATSLRDMFGAKDTPLFRGRLSIFVFKDRFGYEEFNASVHGRDVPREVVGHSMVSPITQEEALIAMQDVGDAASETSPGIQLNLMEQLAGAFLKRESRENLPDWLVRGTGLALGARANLGDEFVDAQRKEVVTVLKNSRLERPEQIFESGTFSPSEVGPVGITVVEFLLKQGGGAKFGQFVKQLQSGERVATAIRGVYGADAKALALAYGTSYAGAAGSGSGKKKK